MPVKSTKPKPPPPPDCVLKLVPECPKNGFNWIHYPDPDSTTVVPACCRCVGTLVRQKIEELGETPEPQPRP